MTMKFDKTWQLQKIQRDKMDWLIAVLFVVVVGVVLKKIWEAQRSGRQIRMIPEAVGLFTCGMMDKVMVKLKNSPTASTGSKVKDSRVDVPGRSSNDVVSEERRLQLRMVELNDEVRSVEEKLKLLQSSKNWQQQINRSGDPNDETSGKAEPAKYKAELQPQCYIQKSDLKRKKWNQRSGKRTPATAGKRHEINSSAEHPQKDEKVKSKSKRDKSNPKTKNLLFQEIQDPKEEAKLTTASETEAGEDQKTKLSDKIMQRLKQIKSKKFKKSKKTAKSDESLTASDRSSSRSDSDENSKKSERSFTASGSEEDNVKK
ncbi:hypothetical protein T01_10880 [Trichinella spiralis]|uniref:Uncharacterized protein n=1 Tax=Trichinella spiralis TaxID=6334 RepID=A0A0V1BQV8_TRISP|nr:hypothetical protein T01_10880 [Trichinella spiralis]